MDSDKKYRELVREDRILRIGQLTASLSHELNQPLTAILSTAQAGIRFIDSQNANSELLKELFRNIVEDDKRTASILSSIRGMMKLEKREKEKVNLNELIDEVYNMYIGEAIRRNIKMNINLSDVPVYIIADQTQIQQVLLNFILNAFQSMDKVNNKDKTISITEFTDNDHVTVSVKDQGTGIEESIKDNIFKPFVTTKKDGSGIGLAISHSIIEDHKGNIWAKNIPDGGAEFSFSLKTVNGESR
jgi:two-component system sensor kinase FixL